MICGWQSGGRQGLTEGSKCGDEWEKGGSVEGMIGGDGGAAFWRRRRRRPEVAATATAAAAAGRQHVSN